MYEKFLIHATQQSSSLQWPGKERRRKLSQLEVIDAYDTRHNIKLNDRRRTWFSTPEKVRFGSVWWKFRWCFVFLRFFRTLLFSRDSSDDPPTKVKDCGWATALKKKTLWSVHRSSPLRYVTRTLTNLNEFPKGNSTRGKSSMSNFIPVVKLIGIETIKQWRLTGYNSFKLRIV